MRGGKPEPKLSTSPYKYKENHISNESKGWLNALQSTERQQKVSFSSYFSNDIRSNKSICTLLPLIPESINSHAVVAHCMKQVSVITEKANPGQRPIITADQPVYALCKQVQMIDLKFKRFFCKMGDLHTEMAFLSCIGDWLEGSGWTEIYDKSGISSKGRVENFLKGSKVKRTRYAHHVTLKVLVDFTVEAFNSSSCNDFEKWKEMRKKESSTAFYWFTTMEMIIVLSMFVRSIINCNFELYMHSLRAMLPWFFALDHTHYSRWLTVYVNDLEDLQEDSHLLMEFISGKFAVNKTGKSFSSMGEDQAHEQHNKIIKENGGGIGIFTNPKAILEWSLTSSFISDMLLEKNEDDSSLHHENNDRYETTYRNDCDSLYKSWKSFGNPFNDISPLVHMTSRIILSDDSERSVRKAHEIGLRQYEDFNEKRSSLYDTIKKNKLPLFRQKNLHAS